MIQNGVRPDDVSKLTWTQAAIILGIYDEWKCLKLDDKERNALRSRIEHRNKLINKLIDLEVERMNGR